jgi:uncharacterized protein YggT (Ycf19 family)
MSWFPIDTRNEFIRQLYKITDPYLEFFQKSYLHLVLIDYHLYLRLMVLEAIRRVVMINLPF